MITFLLVALVAILAIGLVALAWGANNRKRAGQSAASTAQAVHDESPKTGRATGPD